MFFFEIDWIPPNKTGAPSSEILNREKKGGERAPFELINCSNLDLEPLSFICVSERPKDIRAVMDESKSRSFASLNFSIFHFHHSSLIQGLTTSSPDTY